MRPGGAPTVWVGLSAEASSGKTGFQALEFGEERVVVGVGDFRLIEGVIEMVVAQDLGAQQFDSIARDDDFVVAD